MGPVFLPLGNRAQLEVVRSVTLLLSVTSTFHHYVVFPFIIRVSSSVGSFFLPFFFPFFSLPSSAFSYSFGPLFLLLSFFPFGF